MSVQTKKRFKNLGKIIGIALFALLMFTNIKVALMDDAEIASGDVSILGIEVNLFEATVAETTVSGNPSCVEMGIGCFSGGNEICIQIYTDFGYITCYYPEWWGG